jgi:protein-disulfide isomerase
MDQFPQPKSQSFFDLLNGRSAFWLGFVTAILALGTLGFILLGSVVLKGGSFEGLTRTDNSADALNDDLAIADAGAVPSPEPTSVPVVSDDDHIRGNKDAEITIIEYSDFECPFCGNFHPTMQQVMTNYEGKVRWIYRHFPLSFHPSALPAANAAECASEQGKFWEYADQLFVNQANLSDSFYKQLATQQGLNVSKWENCYKTNKYNSKIELQSQEGANAGVSGTPGSFIIDKNGNAIPIKGALPYSSVSAAIDQLLKG